ncbi:MAG: hypothetical protein WC622_02675 [Pedobacter sp.]|jgi:hypothetical protein|uniref:hypothetical protein n=1 Tax=Pedobacter sp. TaxID=1411316 RepID=UPI003566FA3E
MQAKKKKKKTIIAKTTQPRAMRLQRAKSWLSSYEGKNVVRGYAKKYRVDLLCAIAELRTLGVEIKPEYEQAVRQTIVQRVEQNKTQKEVKNREFDGISDHQDGDFAYIAGYTIGGAPYGIRWEEMDGAQLEE